MKKSLLVSLVLLIFAVSCYNPFLQRRDNDTDSIPITNIVIGVTAPSPGNEPDTSVITSGSFEVTSLTWSPAHNPFLGNTTYTVTILLTANSGYTFNGLESAIIDSAQAVISNNTGNTVTLSRTFLSPNAAVTSISVSSQPAKLVYTHGDTLDLTGLEVTVFYIDNTNDTVSIDNFGTRGVTIYINGSVIVNGSLLSRTLHNGHKITVSYTGKTDDTEVLTINKIDPDVTWPTNLTATFGQTLSNVSLPGNGTSAVDGTFAWVIPGTSVGNAGTRSHSLRFTPNDTANYNTLEQNVNVRVKTNPIVNWPENHTVGSSQLILSDNWQLRNINGTQGTFSWANPGTAITSGQQHPMRFMPDDIDNYSIPNDVLVTVIVVTPLTSPRGIEMVWIPAGTFTMGSPTDERNRGTGDSELQHQVTLTRGFFMGKYQVTQEQWFAVMGTWPSFFTGENNSSNAIITPVFNRNNLPVEQVTWYDAIVFCNRLSMAEVLIPAYEMQTEADPSVWSSDPGTWGAVPTSSNTRWNVVRIVDGSTGYRLPTEAQWEYACRAGTATAFYNGNNYADTGYNNDLVGAVAWFGANSGSRTHEVGLKAPNAWGLYDKHGNVFEWCWDWFGNYTSEAKTDPTGPAGSFRVIRGGSWVVVARDLRSALRYFDGPNRGYSDYGFRLLRP